MALHATGESFSQGKVVHFLGGSVKAELLFQKRFLLTNFRVDTLICTLTDFQGGGISMEFFRNEKKRHILVVWAFFFRDLYSPSYKRISYGHSNRANSNDQTAEVTLSCGLGRESSAVSP